VVLRGLDMGCHVAPKGWLNCCMQKNYFSLLEFQTRDLLEKGNDLVKAWMSLHHCITCCNISTLYLIKCVSVLWRAERDWG
jgi:hypothetical protein